MDSQIAATSAHEDLDVGWQAPKGMLGLSFKIFFLRIITLGIYHFWGKTEVRRRIWNAVRINGEPLEYTGTGKELFLGFLIAVFLIFLPLIAITMGAQLQLGQNNPIAILVMAIVYAVIFYLIGLAQYSARRYRLARTRWRGIRGTMTGSPKRYAITFFWTSMLIPLTLGWSIPWQQIKLQKILTRETAFGNQNFAFEATSKHLYKRFAVPWFGAILFYGAIGGLAYSQQGAPNPTLIPVFAAVLGLGFVALIIAGFWYNSKVMNYYAASTRFDQAQFSLATTTWSLIGLMLMNMLIMIISFGIAMPIIQARVVRYIITRMDINGGADLASISQAQDILDSTGEGLAQAFDIDIF